MNRSERVKKALTSTSPRPMRMELLPRTNMLVDGRTTKSTVLVKWYMLELVSTTDTGLTALEMEKVLWPTQTRMFIQATGRRARSTVRVPTCSSRLAWSLLVNGLVARLYLESGATLMVLTLKVNSIITSLRERASGTSATATLSRARTHKPSVPNKLKMTLSSHGRPPLTSLPCSKTDSLFVKAVEDGTGQQADWLLSPYGSNLISFSL